MKVFCGDIKKLRDLAEVADFLDIDFSATMTNGEWSLEIDNEGADAVLDYYIKEYEDLARLDTMLLEYEDPEQITLDLELMTEVLKGVEVCQKQ